MDKVKNKEEFLKLLSSIESHTDLLIAWLEKSDFFEAPASAKHHLAESGGLCQHTLNVLKQLVRINNGLGLAISSDTVITIALLHDICKANYFTIEKRNRKNEETGKWEKYDAYAYDDLFPCGHGEKSVIILQKYMPLEWWEVLAIRWHMGAWGAPDFQSQQALSKACELHPAVFALQMADQAATFWDESNQESSK